MPKTIAIVEDDLKLAGLIRDYLSHHGFNCILEQAGDRAIFRVPRSRPDLVILDWMLPKIDGVNVCRELRQYFDGPIIMLTAKEGDQAEITGLQAGADAYLKKPIDPEVLLAHIQALLRRSQQAVSPMVITIGKLLIDPSNQQVYWCNQYIDLSRKEFELLYLLAHHAGKVLNRDNIMQALRGFDYDGVNRSIDMTIASLRKKLHDEAAKGIKTIWGKGYLFAAEAW